MDSKRFDRLAAVVAQITSRRSLVRGLAAGSAGSLFGLLGARMAPQLADEAAAKKKKCNGNQKKCGSKCIPKSGCCKTSDCKKPSNPCERVQCQGNKCKKSLQPNGTACGQGQICIDGECLAECEPGGSCDGDETCCSSICVDTDTSFENCGGCGEACDADTADTCAGGECQCGDEDPCEGDLVCTTGDCTCPGNQENCSGTTCTNTNTDFDNCGGCGDECDAEIADNCAGGECKCGNSDACEGEFLCISGACACPAGQKPCGSDCIPNADTCFTRVTANNLHGWLLQGEDPFSQNPALTQIVTGPADVPAPGDGSVKLNPTAFGAFAEGDTQAVVRTLQYEGTKVGDIDTLAYSIFVPTTAGDPPTMQLAVIGINDAGSGVHNTDNFASLVFLPGANGNAAPNLDDWTDYTPSESGVWRSTRDVLGASNECLICRSIGSKPHEGNCTVPANCSGVENVTWNQIQTIIPNAALNGASASNGSFSFRIGRGDTGEGNVTNVVFNGDGYFFEED